MQIASMQKLAAMDLNTKSLITHLLPIDLSAKRNVAGSGHRTTKDPNRIVYHSTFLSMVVVDDLSQRSAGGHGNLSRVDDQILAPDFLKKNTSTGRCRSLVLHMHGTAIV